MIFVFILSMAGMCYGLRHFLALRWQQTPFVALSVSAVLLYLTAITGFLNYGIILSLSTGIMVGIYALYKKKITFEPTKKNICSLLLSGIPFLLIGFAIKDSYTFSAWDEFSFWGPSLKIIYETGSLYNNDSAILFKNYPPLQQLIQYYFLYSFGWSEANALRGHDFFILSAMLFSSATVIKRSSTLAAVAFISSTTLIYLFKYDLKHILVDHFLAVVVLAGMVCALSDEEKTRRYILPLIIFILPAIKQTGLVFALFIVSLQLLNAIFHNTANIQSRVKAIAGQALLSIAMVLISFKSWGWYLARERIGASYDGLATFDFASDAFLKKVDGTLATFAGRIHEPFYTGIHLSILQTFIAGSLLSVLFISLSPVTSRLKASLNSIALVLMLFSYTLFLLFCYLVFFSDYEALILASFERYLATFLLPWFALFMLHIISLSWCGRKRISTIAVLMMLIPVCISQKGYFKGFFVIKPSQEEIVTRREVNNLADKIYPILNREDKVFFIYQNSNGYEMNIFQYLLQPFMTNRWCWTLGEKYYPGDQWTCQQDLQSAAKGYNYLAIQNSDEQFWKNNERYFTEGKSNSEKQGIYKINWSGDIIKSVVAIRNE